jgi:hypothetical protein
MKYPQYTLGLVTGFCLGCLTFMVPILIDGVRAPEEPQTEQPRFEVVDEYHNGCKVVKWNGKGHYAEYKFFLDCSSENKK